MSVFDDGASAIADPFLRRAYLLGERGRGATSPNPMVGCVLVREGRVVGEGWHAGAGLAHAEAVALAAAGSEARGARAYVTLEPCTHTGRTPPCAQALVAAGVGSVVIGMRDPNAAVSGGGAELLRTAGLGVEMADDPSPFQGQNEAWLKRLRTGRPFVRVKCALTLDGHAALREGRRAQITGEGGWGVTMSLRSRANAVAVGASTAAIDDPELTVRDRSGTLAEQQPLRVVIGRTRVPGADRRLVRDRRARSLVIVSDRAERGPLRSLQAAGVTVSVYPFDAGISGALKAIADVGVDDLLVEAGPGLMTALWGAGAVDELVVVVAGGMGGEGAPPLFRGAADGTAESLEPRMRAVEARVVDEDTVSVWRPREAS